MKYFCFNSLIFAILFLAATSYGKHIRAKNSSVQVQVYYESLCPYSIRFITKQLYPTYVELKDLIKLELIPYGHATEELVNGTKTFTCQHGPEECYGNKIHSCAIDMYTLDESTEFIYCSEGADSPTTDSNLEKCAASSGLSWTDLQECLSSGKADDLLSAMGKKTDLLNPTGVPAIVIDGTYTDENEEAALEDFRGLICSLVECPAISV